MHKFARHTGLAALALALAGCATPFEQTSDLKAVHDVYQEEFESSLLAADPQRDTTATFSPGSFERTLAAIEDYRRRYPDATQENNHLTILEGMVYLQSGQHGLARLAQQDVERAGANLTDSGNAPRDALFARTFGDLVTGWEAIGGKVTVTPDNAGRVAMDLQDAVEGIEDDLCTEKTAARLQLVAGDQGATFLAATGAIFYSWADSYLDFACHPDDGGTAASFCAQRKEATNLVAGRNLTWTFLPPKLQTFVQQTDGIAPTEATSPGSLRYLNLIAWLNRQIIDRPATAGDYADVCVEMAGQ